MDNCGNKLPFSYNLSHKNIITKLPESGMFCEYITEYITDSGVVKVHMTLGGGNPSTTQTKSYCHTVCQTKLILFLYPIFSQGEPSDYPQ